MLPTTAHAPWYHGSGLVKRNAPIRCRTVSLPNAAGGIDSGQGSGVPLNYIFPMQIAYFSGDKSSRGNAGEGAIPFQSQVSK